MTNGAAGNGVARTLRSKQLHHGRGVESTLCRGDIALDQLGCQSNIRQLQPHRRGKILPRSDRRHLGGQAGDRRTQEVLAKHIEGDGGHVERDDVSGNADNAP